MMFTSRCITLALLSFLAGANACTPKCPATVKVSYTTAKLTQTIPQDYGVECVYNLSGVSCDFNSDGGLIDGDPACPNSIPSC
ncbi:uncharacterized protein EDB91DRAFT_1173601 [Suillus paluster]|uniref:uncharacterized protein n=1 Tax=Suillus paluster TaxID=48578 RepID=UPI001B85D14F|nr:uncharacterized protein EDB91DRAFT_1173601 [Suillus paluster]KAG1723070.1 hypothetical protein EDB91DRAFT_1173601 [Suillus paluster]